MRVVLDTNVLVSAFLSSRGAPAQILQFLEQEAFDLLISPEIVQEYAAALGYERVKKVHKLSDAQVQSVLEDLKAVATLVQPVFTPAVVTEDADDDKFFACAIEGGADIIVSGDARVQAVKEYQGIQVLSPAVFVALLTQGQS